MYMDKLLKDIKNNFLKINPLKSVNKKINFLNKSNNMQKVLLLVGILLVLFAIHKFFLKKEGFVSSVTELEDEVSNKKSMVLFYADWCGHCKKFIPQWDKLSSSWNDTNENVKLMKVDCGKPNENNDHKEIMEKYQIDGYPTILVFEEGKAKPYDGKRDVPSIENFLSTL